jgi:Flp pilus assembly protein TadD
MGNPLRAFIPTFLFAGVLFGLGGCSSAPASAKALADAYYDVGNAWFEMKKFDQADKAYQNALHWNPDLKIAVLNLARTKAEIGDVATALAMVAPLAEAEPDNLVVAQYQAWLVAKKDGPAAAADLYTALAHKLPGDAATQFNAGFCLDAAGRTAEALVALKTWKALDGKGFSGLSTLAMVLDKSDPQEAAEVWLDAAAALPEGDAKRFQPLSARAKDLEASELYGDAVEALTTALALPVTADQARGEVQFQLGSLLLLRIEDYPKGSQALIEAWKAGYHDETAWKALRANPSLKYGVRLEADLKLAGVAP